MSLLEALQTSASGLSAQKLRMNLIAGNLANINTTRTPEGGPYKRKDAVFKADPQPIDFKDTLSRRLAQQHIQVQVTEIREDNRPPILKYEPGHPDADAEGYIALPNINVMEEMVNMISAGRSYEANATAIRATKEMAAAAIDIGR
jgi:flagellar basal-body rod protein FlgC